MWQRSLQLNVQQEFKSPQQHHTGCQDRRWGRAIKPLENQSAQYYGSSQNGIAEAQGGKSLLWQSQSLRCGTDKCRGRPAMLNPGIATASYHLLTRLAFILLSLVESQPGAFSLFAYFAEQPFPLQPFPPPATICLLPWLFSCSISSPFSIPIN